METTLGSFDILLDPETAPITAENFMVYVDEGFFDGSDGLGATIFHRVIADFMNQGGGYTADGTTKATHSAIALESEVGLSNLRGTIAMARTSDPDSATSQFFINTVDNTFLDYESASNPGYAVFGEVVSGMDVVDAIAAVETDGSDQPLEDIVVTSCTRPGG
jgi:cyclophilin family peptidyl-prolyl cis-trans isomerase